MKCPLTCGRLPQSRGLPGLLVSPVFVHNSAWAGRLNLCVSSIRPWAPPDRDCVRAPCPHFTYIRGLMHILQEHPGMYALGFRGAGRETQPMMGNTGWNDVGRKGAERGQAWLCSPNPPKLCTYYTVLFVTLSLSSPGSLSFTLCLYDSLVLDVPCNRHHITVILRCLVCFSQHHAPEVPAMLPPGSGWHFCPWWKNTSLYGWAIFTHPGVCGGMLGVLLPFGDCA